MSSEKKNWDMVKIFETINKTKVKGKLNEGENKFTMEFPDQESPVDQLTINPILMKTLPDEKIISMIKASSEKDLADLLSYYNYLKNEPNPPYWYDAGMYNNPYSKLYHLIKTNTSHDVKRLLSLGEGLEAAAVTPIGQEPNMEETIKPQSTEATFNYLLGMFEQYIEANDLEQEQQIKWKIMGFLGDRGL